MMSDPRQRMALKEQMPASPVSGGETVDTTCASTVATNSRHPQNSEESGRSSPVEPTSRELMRRQVLHLGLASSGAASIFVLSVVPLNILVGMTLVFFLWIAFLFRGFQWIQSEFQTIMRGRGLGAILPASLYETLVNTSFHELMTDGTFVRENQHFMLYFIPGLSPEQISNYVDRLVPRHRRRLHQPGIGNFAGEGLMRLLIGDEGLAERQIDHHQPVPQRVELLPTSESDDSTTEPEHEGHVTRRLVPRRLELEVINEDAASGLGDDWGTESTTVENRNPDVTRADIDDLSEESESLSVEDELVVDAAVSGAVHFVNFALSYSQHVVASSIVRAGGRLVRVALGAGAVALGAGAISIWSGVLSPRDLRLPSQISRETRDILSSSAFASGATAGLFVLFGLAKSPPPPPVAKSPSSGGTKK